MSMDKTFDAATAEARIAAEWEARGAFAAGANACTLTPHCRLKARLAHAEAAFIDELNRSTLADCVYLPEEA